MACELANVSPRPVREDVSFLPWSPRLLTDHATVLFQSFQHDPERSTFPSLGTETGCRDLMHAMASLPNFCPASTWLAIGSSGPVGSIQGIILPRGDGEIQNLAVVPSVRGISIGTELLDRGLRGFRETGCARVILEVSATNDRAIRLYRKFGFRSYKTVYLPAYGNPPTWGQGI